MRFRAAALACVLALPLGFAGTSRAEGQPPALVISGAANSTTSWVLDKAITVSTDSGLPAGKPTVGVATAGDYAGFMLHTQSGALLGGAVAVRGFTVMDRYTLLNWFGPFRESMTLTPGTYRVTFLGDKPGQIRLPFLRGGSGRDVKLAARTPTRDVRAKRVQVATDVPLPIAMTRMGFTSTGKDWLLVSAFQSDSLPGRRDIRLCIGPSGARCAPVLDDQHGFEVVGGGAGGMSMHHFARPGVHKAGMYDAAITFDTTGISTSRIAFVLTAP